MPSLLSLVVGRRADRSMALIDTGIMLSPADNGTGAETDNGRSLIQPSTRGHGGIDQLTIHSDRGPSIKSKPVALLLSDLGVSRSFNRPHVSNDDPCLEGRLSSKLLSTARSSQGGSVPSRMPDFFAKGSKPLILTGYSRAISRRLTSSSLLIESRRKVFPSF